MHAETTIAAISSPPGAARRGVIRISGPGTAGILQKTCRVAGEWLRVSSRGAHVARFDDGTGEQPALVLWMPGPRSFTREDVAELHLPGATRLLDCALQRILEFGAEAAEPGEFTRRAFLNGRIDLTRAEGVLALVSARNREQQRAATALLFGGLGDRMEVLRDSMDALRALCEASLDFDESDTGHVPTAELVAGLKGVREGVEEALAFEDRRAVHEGQPRLVLVGAPNAGKSSLFNRLVSGERAIDEALVSHEAGTTRDAKGASWTVGGLVCRLVDTAGMEVTESDLEREAQEFSRRESRAADLWLWVVDGSSSDALPPDPPWASSAEDEERDVILILNKSDLGPGEDPQPGAFGGGTGVHGPLRVSARTGDGIEELTRVVARVLGLEGAHGDRGGAGTGGFAGVGRELHVRHRDALIKAAVEIDEAARGLEESAPLDLVAEALRAATDELDRITGRTTPEGLLDRIFARFCLGK